MDLAAVLLAAAPPLASELCARILERPGDGRSAWVQLEDCERAEYGAAVLMRILDGEIRGHHTVGKVVRNLRARLPLAFTRSVVSMTVEFEALQRSSDAIAGNIVALRRRKADTEREIGTLRLQIATERERGHQQALEGGEDDGVPAQGAALAAGRGGGCSDAAEPGAAERWGVGGSGLSSDDEDDAAALAVLATRQELAVQTLLVAQRAAEVAVARAELSVACAKVAEATGAASRVLSAIADAKEREIVALLLLRVAEDDAP